jgi:aminoglycoside phosphotransferase (APT) family kinase protein
MIKIDVDLVTELIKSQFPEWSNLGIKPVKKGGNDNRTFHLGKSMSVMLPSDKAYVPQVKNGYRF